MAEDARSSKRRGGKLPRPTLAVAKKRVSYRISVTTWQRLGVHCRLADADEAAFVERAVLALLRQAGKGQGIFEAEATEDRGDVSAA